MSTVQEKTASSAADIPMPPQNLLETDDIPLETDWHRLAMNLLIEVVCYHFRERNDFFAGGNMFLYFSARQARDRDYRGPDFFYVDGTERDRERLYWAVWEEEGRYPNVIIELSSPSTAEEDHTTKFRICERTFRTPEYFICDPETRRLEGWRLDDRHRYRPIKPDERGWLWSEELGLWLGPVLSSYLFTERHYLRFFDPEGRMLPTIAEAAEQERTRAEAAETRAQTAEAEVERLRHELKRARRAGKKPKS